MKSNRSGFYWLTILVLGLVAGFALILSGMAPISDDPVLSEGSVRPAVFARLSQIRQGTEPKLNDETFNANEEDAEEVTRNLPLDVIPQIVPQHVDSYDRISAANVDRMTAVKPPLVKKLFTGLKNTGGNQPDSILAVGPSHVLLAVNSNIGIYTKDGRRRFITSFYNWFEPLAHTSGGSIIFDPRLLYDQYSHHYVFLCTTRRADHRSWYLLSVSKTSDPEGEWAFWALDMQINGQSSRLDSWADFPRLGVDQNALYLTANMYTFGTYIFRYSKIRVLRKRDLFAFGSLPYFEFAQMIDAAGVYAHSIEPAHSFDSAPSEFLVNTRMDAANKITLWKITTPDAGKPVLVKIPVKVSSFQAPPPALQKGGGATINTATEGTGVLSVTYRNGFVYTVQPVAKNWGSRRVSALRIYQMDSSGKLVQETTYGSDGVDYYMPAISVDSHANVVIAFSRSSAKDFAGFYVAGRTSSATPGQFSQSIPLQRGLANYQIIFRGTNIARWGDYNGLTLAPDDTFWAFGEYAASSTQWQTVVSQLGY